mmetsp:Transcript_4508/g.16685  ORF Transcript_4508/g.16685 Transcript_4508/m.16685 type:complete len:240 (+) Transcript_4508:1429-2148(+)
MRPCHPPPRFGRCVATATRTRLLLAVASRAPWQSGQRGKRSVGLWMNRYRASLRERPFCVVPVRRRRAHLRRPRHHQAFPSSPRCHRRRQSRSLRANSPTRCRPRDSRPTGTWGGRNPSCRFPTQQSRNRNARRRLRRPNPGFLGREEPAGNRGGVSWWRLLFFLVLSRSMQMRDLSRFRTHVRRAHRRHPHRRPLLRIRSRQPTTTRRIRRSRRHRRPRPPRRHPTGTSRSRCAPAWG